WPGTEHRFALGEDVEGHEHGRRFTRQLAHPALGRMQAKLQSVERDRAGRDDQQLAVEDELAGFQPGEHGFDFREVSTQWLARFRPELDIIAGADGNAAKAIPLGLILPALAVWQFLG